MKGKKRPKKRPKVNLPSLFPDLPDHPVPGSISQAINGQVWTEQKAQLIARYLRLFVFITKHGAYIDGFGAPKEAENPHTWAAKLVLESEPRWLRQFYLCDLPERAPLLKSLADEQPEVAKRTIEVFAGDFNKTVLDVLKSPLISGKTATFCLLDQFSTECHWKTVQALAQHKGAGFNKIELFYFLAAGWVFRSLDAFKDDVVPSAWWGKPDWQSLKGLSQSKLALVFTKRFQEELGYRFVNAWPIFKQDGGRGRIMFYMIHASDHPQAPILMRRSYENIVQPLESEEQLRMEFGSVDGDLGPASSNDVGGTTAL